MTLSDNTRGALLMIGSMAAFSLGDAAIKATGGAVPLSQILVLRGIAATAFIAGLAGWLGQLHMRFPAKDWALIVLRSMAEVGAAYTFLLALLNMPLANVTALLQMLPLTVTLGSALVFRDPVGWRRWTAIAIGFGGMLLIVRPGAEGFNTYALYGLTAVLCVTIRDLVTRRLSRDVPSLMVTLVASAAVLGFGAVWSLNVEWVPLTPQLGMLIGLATIFIIGGYTFSVMVMRVGDISFIAPFRYTGLLWAIVLGVVLFGDIPDAYTLIGAGIIIATGIFTMWREAQAKRKRM